MMNEDPRLTNTFISAGAAAPSSDNVVKCYVYKSMRPNIQVIEINTA